MFDIEPRTHLLVVFGIMAVGCLLGAGFSVAYLPASGHYGWFLATFPLLLVMAIQFARLVLTKWKSIRVSQGKLLVKFRFLPRSNQVLDLAQLRSWHEVEVSTTKTQKYLRLQLVFPNGALKLSNLEYSNYDKLKALLKKQGKPVKS